MDGNQLFWATGINNAGLQTDAQSAIAIFQNLSTQVKAHLESIIQKYNELHQISKVKFENPVDASMISSIKAQIEALGKVIDMEIQKLGQFTATYDKSMQKIQTSASKLKVPGNSPLAPMVAGIKADVEKTSEHLSFIERRFKYAIGSAVAYGAMRIFRTLGRDIIEVKTQFEFLQTAINSFAGSAEKGAKIMEELVSFAIRSPLQINDITEAAKQLMAFGIEADKVVGQIKMLSDVAAGAGKPIKDIAYLYGKSLTEEKVYTRTLMQFGNAGIPMYRVLAETMGTTTENIKKMTRAGTIGFLDIQRALESLTAAGGQYYNFSGKMMETTAGQISNLKDKWIKAMKELGEQNDGIINAGVSGISYLMSHWEELGKILIATVAIMGSYAVASKMVVWQMAAETAGTTVLGAAKARLLAITVSLNTAIMANPYAAVLVGITAFVAIMWALTDSSTEAEKAQRRLKKSLDETQAYYDRMSRRFGDDLDIIKNKTLDGTSAQLKAYQDLTTVFGAIIGIKSLDQLKTIDSIGLQNKVNKTLEYNVLLLKKKKIAEAEVAYKKQEQLVFWPNKNPSKENVEKALKSTSEAGSSKLRVLLDTVNLAKKDYDDSLAAYEESRKPVPPEYIAKDKEYWSKRKTEATDALDSINVAERKALDAAYKGKKLTSVDGVDSAYLKIYNDNKEKLAEATKNLLVYNDKAEGKLNDASTKAATAAAARLAAIVTAETKLADIATKAEITLADAQLAAMDEGYAKQKAIQEIKFAEQLLAVKKQGEEMLKVQNDIAKNAYLAKNPKGTPPIAATELNTDNQTVLDNLTKAAGIENEAVVSKLLKDKLIEYGDYTAERLEIERKFNADIAALGLERNATNSEQVDMAIRQAETDKAKALMAQSFKKLKESPEFAMAFEDLGNVSTATLEKLMAELEKYKQTAAGTMKLNDFKEYSKVIENLTDEFIQRNPFKVLKESADDLAVAQRNLDTSKFNLSTVQSGGKINNKGQLIPNGSKEKALSLAGAMEKVAEAENDIWLASNKGQKALKEITDSFGELSKNLSSVGSSVGGAAGQIISAIGDIGSFVTSAITGWEAASIGAATAIQVVEKASVILAVIAGVIQVATVIVNLFTEASKKRREEAEAERQSILDVKQAYLEAYAAMTNKKFDNIFGEDVWGKAVAQSQLLKVATKNYQTALTNFISTNAYTSAKWKTIFGTNWATKDVIDGFDLVAAKAALAGDTLDEAAKASLQSMVDAYESYQSYLDGIDSYLNSVFGDIGDNMMESFTSKYDDLTSWADDVTGYISDSFGQMVKDIIYSMYFAQDLADAQAAIKAALTDTDTNDAAQIQALMIELNKELMAKGILAASTYKSMLDSWVNAGGTDWTKTADTNSTVSAIKGMDQPTADILTAQFSAIRINVAAILAKMPDGSNINMININVKDILLSLQTQANSLQMVFSDISKIQINTARLEAMESYLYKMVTNGIKML